MHSQPALLRLRTNVLENPAVSALRDLARALHQRWLAISFARRFYCQARTGDTAVLVSPAGDSQAAAAAQDFAECVIHRSLPPRFHALVQLRIASQLASIAETRLRAQICRQHGWSDEQIGAALLGNTNAHFSEPEKLILRYVEDMTRTPIDVDPQVVRQLRTHFSHSDVIELTASIAHENFRIRFAEARGKLR
ncbi:MAG: carboxymuconolactone decarboxylase family protein [Terriglobales bacterium]